MKPRTVLAAVPLPEAELRSSGSNMTKLFVTPHRLSNKKQKETRRVERNLKAKFRTYGFLSMPCVFCLHNDHYGK